MTVLCPWCFLTCSNSIVPHWCFSPWCHLFVCGVPVWPCPSCFLAEHHCVPQVCPHLYCFPGNHCCVSPSVLLPCRALQLGTPQAVPICAAFPQSTDVVCLWPPRMSSPCCCPAEHCVLPLCSPQDVCFCIGLWQSTAAWPHCEPWPVAVGHPCRDRPDLCPPASCPPPPPARYREK